MAVRHEQHFQSPTMSDLTWQDFEWEAEIEGLSGRKQDLILNPDTDPFNIAAASKRYRAWGRWFCDLFHQFYGFDLRNPAHLRRIHYRLVSNDTPIPMVGSNAQDYEVSPIWIVPRGSKKKKGEKAGDERPNVYLNTNECWLRLCKAAKWARVLDMIDSDRIIDNRSPDAILNDWDQHRNASPVQPAWAINTHSFDLDEFALDEIYLPDPPPQPRLAIEGIRWYEQRYSHYIEVWVEKSTMNDILEPICKENGITFQTGVGEMSITRVRELMKRIVELDRPARIFYLSDFDPGGISMPMSVARKAEYAVRCDHPGLDLQVVPLAMSREQVAQYGLPTIPLKETEGRGDKFKERQEVDGAVELDALEALHPGELARIVTDAISPFRLADSEWRDDLLSLDSRLTRQATAVNTECRKRYGDELDELGNEFERIWDRIEMRFLDLQEQGKEQIAEWIAKAKPVYDEARGYLEANRPQLDPDDIPTPGLIRHPDPLMDSEFSYTQQMRRYRRHTGNRNIDDLLDQELDY